MKDFEIDPDELASIFFDSETETDFPKADTNGIIYIDNAGKYYNYSTAEWLETEYQ